MGSASLLGPGPPFFPFSGAHISAHAAALPPGTSFLAVPTHKVAVLQPSVPLACPLPCCPPNKFVGPLLEENHNISGNLTQSWGALDTPSQTTLLNTGQAGLCLLCRWGSQHPEVLLSGCPPSGPSGRERNLPAGFLVPSLFGPLWTWSVLKTWPHRWSPEAPDCPFPRPFPLCPGWLALPFLTFS